MLTAFSRLNGADHKRAYRMIRSDVLVQLVEYSKQVRAPHLLIQRPVVKLASSLPPLSRPVNTGITDPVLLLVDERTGQAVTARTGQLVVGFEPSLSTVAQTELESRLGLERRSFSVPGRFGIYRSTTDLSLKLKELASESQVLFAEPDILEGEDDRILQTDAEDATLGVQLTSELWNREIIGTPKDGKPDDGSGVVIAVVDGLMDETHPALAGTLICPTTKYQFGTFLAVEQHGMGVASIIAGQSRFPQGPLLGIAPSAKILPIAIDLSSRGALSDRAQAIYLLDAIARRTKAIERSDGVEQFVERLIVNCSWRIRDPASSVALTSAFRALADSPAICVCSAGNDGNNKPHYPSDFPGVISVAAITKTREKLEMSNYGTSISWCAPGGTGTPIDADEIVAAVVNGKLGYVIGTSFAAPHVSGVLAAHWSRNPELLNAQLLTLAKSQFTQSLDQHNHKFAGQLGGLLSLAPSN